MRIMLVEDEPTLAGQVHASMAAAGYAVDRAADGLDAWHLGANEPYDAVILDLGLPRLDGLTVLRRWRAAHVNVPVLILTARDSWTEKVEGIDAGADDYLAKPFRTQVRFGLAPLKRLRQALGAMQARRESRLGGNWPTEVEPMISEINTLLDHNPQALERSRQQAADLAHAVKTPLAVLANEASSLPGPAADAVSRQVDAMRRQVDRHLARARAAGAAAARGQRIEAGPAVRELTRALTRLHGARQLNIGVEGEGHFAGDRQDLVEMLDNLLDNACQWARSQVRIHLREDTAAALLEVLVEDDGPGMPPEARELATTRFGRLDEAAAGSGLGLALVTEIAAMYEGSLELGNSALGSLAAHLRLPAGMA
ncbi:Sensor histidine kinase RcsC [Cupriavidus pinatubonensis]|uniref:histidine kinase n=2 Tax=Cupriavidus pinatubonensis TaxID=248026 RepID=A0ABN7YQ07_9BURK|nr:Sensor histidine kinase RcsC [Cupriavidus pinatubonensis]